MSDRSRCLNCTVAVRAEPPRPELHAECTGVLLSNGCGCECNDEDTLSSLL